MKLRSTTTNASNRATKSGQTPPLNPRVKVVDRVVAVLDFVSRNTKDEAEQQEAVELKRILSERKQTLLAA